jgi:hypothetical protein
MKLWQIIDQIHGGFGQRFQMSASRILGNVSAAQKMAFNRDCRLFEKRAVIDSDSANSTKYLFPDDCRQLKEILTHGPFWVDAFGRTIQYTSHSPPDSIEITYYRRPRELTCFNEESMDYTFRQGTSEGKAALFTDDDEAKLIMPIEWRWQVLGQLATAMCDAENYAEGKTPQIIAEQYLKEFWEAMDKRPNDRRTTNSVGNW